MSSNLPKLWWHSTTPYASHEGDIFDKEYVVDETTEFSKDYQNQDIKMIDNLKPDIPVKITWRSMTI